MSSVQLIDTSMLKKQITTQDKNASPIINTSSTKQVNSYAKREKINNIINSCTLSTLQHPADIDSQIEKMLTQLQNSPDLNEQVDAILLAPQKINAEQRAVLFEYNKRHPTIV